MVLVGSHATASHRAPRQLPRGDLASLSRSARCTASKREEPPCSYHSGSTQLPGDVWWLDSKCQEYRAVLYGTTFVLCRGFQQRPELGLALADSRAQGIQGFSEARPVEVVYHTDEDCGYQGLAARGSGYVTSRFVGEVGNCSLLDKPKERRALPAAPGYLVPLSSVEDAKREGEEGRKDETDIFETSSDSPRRTSKVRFTCNVCGAVNIKSVNPRAMRHGTVFAECGQCCIKHKLVDNLKLFHELTGAVFPAQPSALNTSKLSAAARKLLRERGWEL